MTRVRSLSAMIAVALIAGCAGMPPPDEAQEVAAALARYEQLSALKMEEQRREFTVAQALHERTASDTTRINLALMMLLPRAPWRDDARVQALLGAIEPTPAGQPSARYDLAQLLLRLVAERQRIQRDDQRKADQLVVQLREERRKSEELQQKIDSLRSIDRETYKRKKTP